MNYTFKSVSWGSALLKSLIISRCKQKLRRVLHNVDTYSIDPMSDCWPAVLIATDTSKFLLSDHSYRSSIIDISPTSSFFLRTSIYVRFQLTDTEP